MQSKGDIYVEERAGDLLSANLIQSLAGNVNLHATGWLLIGSIPGVLVGSHLSVRLPDRVLRVALAATLSLSGIKLLDLPHGNTIVVVGLGLWIAGLSAWGVQWRRGRRLQPVAAAD